jgi:hypothetical protein
MRRFSGDLNPNEETLHTFAACAAFEMNVLALNSSIRCPPWLQFADIDLQHIQCRQSLFLMQPTPRTDAALLNIQLSDYVRVTRTNFIAREASETLKELVLVFEKELSSPKQDIVMRSSTEPARRTKPLPTKPSVVESKRKTKEVIGEEEEEDPTQPLEQPVAMPEFNVPDSFSDMPLQPAPAQPYEIKEEKEPAIEYNPRRAFYPAPNNERLSQLSPAIHYDALPLFAGTRNRRPRFTNVEYYHLFQWDTCDSSTDKPMPVHLAVVYTGEYTPAQRKIYNSMDEFFYGEKQALRRCFKVVIYGSAHPEGDLPQNPGDVLVSSAPCEMRLRPSETLVRVDDARSESEHAALLSRKLTYLNPLAGHPSSNKVDQFIPGESVFRCYVNGMLHKFNSSTARPNTEYIEQQMRELKASETAKRKQLKEQNEDIERRIQELKATEEDKRQELKAQINRGAVMTEAAPLCLYEEVHGQTFHGDGWNEHVFHLPAAFSTEVRQETVYKGMDALWMMHHSSDTKEANVQWELWYTPPPDSEDDEKEATQTIRLVTMEGTRVIPGETPLVLGPPVVIVPLDKKAIVSPASAENFADVDSDEERGHAYAMQQQQQDEEEEDTQSKMEVDSEPSGREISKLLQMSRPTARAYDDD